MIEKTDAELMIANKEDWDMYNNLIKFLPTRQGKNGDRLDKYGVEIPYTSGPHIIQHFRKALEISMPERILEIGTNLGVGSSFLLNLFDGYVLSLDISDKDETLDAADYLKKEYGERFDFVLCDSGKSSKLIEVGAFDLCFVDGGHNEPEVTADIQLCIDKEIPYILFDDWYPRFGPGVQISVAKFPQLELVADMDNLRLYKIDVWKIH